MRKSITFLFLGWMTVVFGLFMAIVMGTVVENFFAMDGNGQKLVQAIVMSIIVIPVIYYLYKLVNKENENNTLPSYSIKRLPHFLTGLLLVIVMAMISLITLNLIGWISIEQWNTPSSWLGALLLNMVIALLYEALPEELAIRGFIYDILRNRLSAWQSILVQALIFIAFSAAISVLLVIVSISPMSTLVTLPSQLILHFPFGIALALIRERTGSLWAAVGFHLGYLGVARFLLLSDEYGAPSIVNFKDTIEYGVGSLLSIMFIILGTIILLSFPWRRRTTVS